MVYVHKILIVDDVLEYLRSLELVLRGHFLVSAVVSVQAAKEATTANRYDAALVDVCLDETAEHDRSGLDLVRWLKSRSPELPIVVMSALDDLSLPDEAIRAGADAFLKKPVNLDQLRRTLKTLTCELEK